MSATAEMITRHLTPKGMSFIAMSHDGKPSDMQQQVLAAMGAVHHKAAQSLMLLKYADQSDELRRLLTHLYPLVMDMARRRRWPNNTQYVVGMIRGAVTEVTRPHVCKTCKGIGKVYVVAGRAHVIASHKDLRQMGARWPEGAVKPCERCLGAGGRQPSRHARAQACGIHHEIFKRHWAGKYGEIVNFLSELERMALLRMKRALCS